MTSTPVSTFERILQRDGDDIYRLALLLAPDTARAEAALLRVAALLARAEALDDAAFVEALLRVLPPERPQRRALVPAWAGGVPLLRAVAGLPRMQRLALVLALVRGWEPARAAPFFAGDPAQFQSAARDALLALSRGQGSGIRDQGPGDGERGVFDLLDSANAPAECQPTRAMLALTAATGGRDPAQRGHLALCAACRSAEQAWQQLAATVEQTLRGALRDQRLPVELAEKLRAAARSEPDVARRARVHWLHWAVPLMVIGVVAALIFPRESATPRSVNTGAAPQLPPKELVRRALEGLYAPPTTADAANQNAVWHGRWQIRWVFSDQSSALLNADAWIDPASSRHRVQLAHEAGGGPYEFELADGSAPTLYAVTPNYNAQLYPLGFTTNAMSARLRADADQQRALLQARLQSGAWSIATNYLRQAQAASDLRSWGRQQSADGAPLDIVSFRGNSALGLPIGTPNAPANTTTLLLSLDARDGTLHEVSEVSGPADGEQTRQIVWRFASGEWLHAPDQISAAFDVRQAWNGTARFPERAQVLVNPAFPLSTPSDFLPVAQALLDRWTWSRLPTSVPPNTQSAALMQFAGPDTYAAIYVGGGRRLVVRRLWDATQVVPETDPNDEHITLDERSVTLHAHAPQSYTALIIINPPNRNQQPTFVQVQTSGYTRAELLNSISTLGPLTPQTFVDQSRIFTGPLTQSSNVRDALTRALAPPSGDGVRHTVERVFTRQSRDVSDPLGDPYHLPLFGGRPATVTMEMWFRRLPNGKGEVAEQIRDAQQVFAQWYDSPSGAWNHDRVRDNVAISTDDGNGADGLTSIQRQVLQLFNCPEAQLDQRNGQRVIVVTETDWQTNSCSHPQYDTWLENQRSNASKASVNDFGPSISDVLQMINASTPLTSVVPLSTLIYLDRNGQPSRTETYLGAARSTLLESSELLSDELLADAALPPGTFASQPPAALVTDTYTGGDQWSTIHTIPITEARTLLATPLWTLQTDPQYTLIRTEAGARVAMNRLYLNDAIEDAIEHGLAVRLRYTLADDAPQPLLHLVQGDAPELKAFFRARAWWGASARVQFALGERTVSGWRVRTEAGQIWTLFELDGTLVAADLDTLPSVNEATVRALLARLVRGA